MGGFVMKRRHRNRKMCQELKLINQNLNAIIQNQNELYCKLDQLYAIAKYFGDLERTNRDKPSGSNPKRGRPCVFY